MSVSLKSLCGRSLRLLLLPLVLTLTVSCGVSPLSLLTGGGPNVAVAANTQAGKTNSQTIGTTSNISPSVSDSQVGSIDQRIVAARVTSDRVETITVNEIPAWLLIALVIWSIFLWQLPSPNEVTRWFKGLYGSEKKKAQAPN